MDHLGGVGTHRLADLGPTAASDASTVPTVGASWLIEIQWGESLFGVRVASVEGQ